MEEMTLYRKVAKMADGIATAEEEKAVMQAMECGYRTRHYAELVAGALKNGCGGVKKVEKLTEGGKYVTDV